MDYKDYQCDSQGIELNELEELFEDARYNNYHHNHCDNHEHHNHCDHHDHCNHHDHNHGCCDDGRDCCKRPQPKPIPKKGIIEVQSLLGCSDGEPISGMPIELYKVDCNTGFELVDCKYTDRCGKVCFKCLEDGLYAVKQPVDHCYFEAPEYYPCYEVCISPRNKYAKVVIINKLRDREDCNRPPIRCRCNSEASCQ